MIAWAKRHILSLCTTETLASRKDVLSAALRTMLVVVLVADVLNVVAHATLNAFGALPYPFLPAVTVGLIITTLLASTLTFGIIYVIGLAIHDLSISRARFEHLSRTDQLSGLLNRRAFLQAYSEHQGDASLAVFDIDRFKALNDSFGHDAGDRAIVSVASILTEIFQAPHILARIGGEEFAVLIAGMQADERLALARHGVLAVARTPIALDGRSTSVTVSAGVAEFADHFGFAPLFAAADKALYLAKASGRNLVLHETELPDQIRSDGNNLNVPPAATQQSRRS